MSGLICRKTMQECFTPGMCSPHGGCITIPTTHKSQDYTYAELIILLRDARTALENVGMQDSYINYDNVHEVKQRIDLKLSEAGLNPLDTSP